MVKKKKHVLRRRLEAKGIVKMRANHIDTRFTTLVTFLPFTTTYGDDKAEFELSEDVPVMIFTDGKTVQFEFIEKQDQVFLLQGRKYKLMGYPQETSSMFSIKAFTNIFGKNPEDNVPVTIKKLPEIDPEKLLKEIEAFIRRYIGFFDAKGKIDDDLYKLVSYWVMQSYVYDVWANASYLKVMGQHATGKSTLSRVLELLTFCAERSTSKVSESWFYRTLHCVGGTQVIDEVKISREDYGQFVDILKAGHTKGSFVKLSNKLNPLLAEQFNVFGMKVLSGTDVQNVDPVLSSRMIDIVMHLASKDYDYPSDELYSNEDVLNEARELRDRLSLFRLLYGKTFLQRRKADKESDFFKKGSMAKLKNRDYDVFAPLLILARFYGGRMKVDALVRAIIKQLDIKRQEFFEVYDLPVIRIIVESTRAIERVSLSARQISDMIIRTYTRGDDNPYRKSAITKRYDTDVIVHRLKGLGLHREERVDITEGRVYIFHRVDIDRYAKMKGLGDLYVGRDQATDIQELIAGMRELQESAEEYALEGISIDRLQLKLGFNPQMYLFPLSQERNPKIVQMKESNKWLLISTE